MDYKLSLFFQMTLLIFGPFFDDLYLLRWKILYTICKVPLASFNFNTNGGYFLWKKRDIRSLMIELDKAALVTTREGKVNTSVKEIRRKLDFAMPKLKMSKPMDSEHRIQLEIEIPSFHNELKSSRTPTCCMQ